MADNSPIEWTDATWNPITGCTLVDDGCRNCYAAELAATRLKNHPSRKGLARRNAVGIAKFTGEVRLNERWLLDPLKWSKPRMIFVCAHGDLFHPSVPDEWIYRVFGIMASCPWHTFQVLTKRPDRAQQFLEKAHFGVMGEATDIVCDPCRPLTGKVALSAQPQHDKLAQSHGKHVLRLHQWPLANVWLGTSISDQISADERVSDLLTANAAVRFVSAEPLLGRIQLDRLCEFVDTFEDAGGHPDPAWPLAAQDATWLNALSGKMGAEARGPSGDRLGSSEVGLEFLGGKLDWVICGGESGRRARPMHADWARSLRDQCLEAAVAFHFKQWGAWLPEDQACPSLLDGSPVDSIDQWNWSEAEELGALHFWGDHSASIRLAKKHSGRFLDGRTWDQFPESAA
ncbi:MAG: phage Gp37/Gp68 family protein [Pseudomonadota bacterium]